MTRPAAAGARTADWRSAAILLLFAAAAALYALWLGQSASWDLRNYHLYSPWAWLHHRLDRDIAPAHLQTFFNPLLHVPILLGATRLSPRVFTALLGFVQGLNAIPLWLIARRVLPATLRWREAWALAAALLGASGATQLGELGATQGDNLVTLPYLFGLALLLRPEAGVRGLGRISLGALLIGAAAGLKLTLAPFALGALLGVPLLASDPPWRLRLTAVAAVAMGIGLLSTAGAWMMELQSRYGSPLFPLFGLGLDGAPAVPIDLRDLRFVPNSVARAVFYPIAFALHPRIASEQWFLDLRIPLLFLALPVLLLRRGGQLGEASAAARRFLWLAVSVGYLVWLGGSGYYRYVAPLEMLAPTLLAGELLSRWPQRHAPTVALCILFVLIAATTHAPRWGRIAFGEKFLEVEAPPLPADAIVAFAGDRPLAFLAPALGEEHDYVRVSGGLVGEPLAPWLLDWKVAAALDRGARPVYGLFQDTPAAMAGDYARFGLALDSAHCGTVKANLVASVEPAIQVCPLRRERPALAALDEVRTRWLERCRDPAQHVSERACLAVAAATAPAGQ